MCRQLQLHGRKHNTTLKHNKVRSWRRNQHFFVTFSVGREWVCIHSNRRNFPGSSGWYSGGWNKIKENNGKTGMYSNYYRNSASLLGTRLATCTLVRFCTSVVWKVTKSWSTDWQIDNLCVTVKEQACWKGREAMKKVLDLHWQRLGESITDCTRKSSKSSITNPRNETEENGHCVQTALKSIPAKETICSQRK